MPQDTNTLNFHEMNIYKKLSYIQTQLVASKNNVNQDGNYKYRSAEDILKALKPLLEQCQCIITLSDEIVYIVNRFYIKSTATLIDSNGVSVSATGMAREADDWFNMQASQITGATSSYARKYALGGLFAIDDGSDADKLNRHGKDNTTNRQVANQQQQQSQAVQTNQGADAARKVVTDEQLARAIYLMQNGLNDKNGHPVTKNVLINDYQLNEQQYQLVVES